MRVKTKAPLLAAIVAAVTLLGCGLGLSVKTESFNNPTLPAAQWRLYGGLDIGYAVTLPRDWSGFDLNTQIDLAVGICSLNDDLKQARRQQITSLHDRG